MIDLNRNTGSRLRFAAFYNGEYVTVKAVAWWAFVCGFGIGMAVTALIVGSWLW